MKTYKVWVTIEVEEIESGCDGGPNVPFGDGLPIDVYVTKSKKKALKIAEELKKGFENESN